MYIKMLFLFLIISFAGSAFSQELKPIENNKGKWGLINQNGDTILDCNYDYVYQFSFKNKRIEGKSVICENKNLIRFARNYFHVLNNGKVGIVNNQGKFIAPIKYDSRGFSFSNNGYLIVWLDDKVGYIDTTGYEVVKPIYGDVIDDTLNCYWKEIVYDENTGLDSLVGGHIVSPFIINGLIKVSDKSRYDETSKWGFVDLNGNIVVEPKYNYISDFKNGIAITFVGEVSYDYDLEKNIPVKGKGKFGFVNKYGMEVLKAVNDEVLLEPNGNVKVICSGIEYFFYKNGVCIKDCQ